MKLMRLNLFIFITMSFITAPLMAGRRKAEATKAPTVRKKAGAAKNAQLAQPEQPPVPLSPFVQSIIAEAETAIKAHTRQMEQERLEQAARVAELVRKSEIEAQRTFFKRHAEREKRKEEIYSMCKWLEEQERLQREKASQVRHQAAPEATQPAEDDRFFRLTDF